LPGYLPNAIVIGSRVGVQESLQCQIVARLDEVETLLIVVPAIGKPPGFLLERHVLDDVRRPGDVALGGAQAIDERPADGSALEPEAAEERAGQARLPRSDGADNRPGLAFAHGPRQIPQRDLAARSNGGRIFEEEQ